MRVPRIVVAAPVTAILLFAAPAAPAGNTVKEREIEITKLHLGLTPGGRVGVYLAFTPRRPNALSTVSVAVTRTPRIVFGFYKQRGLSSPLRDPFDNASNLRAGRDYYVRITFCRSATPVPDRSSPEPRRRTASSLKAETAPRARAAKDRCAEMSHLTTRSTLRARFAPPGG